IGCTNCQPICCRTNVGAGVALAAALPYYGGYGYGYESCVQWVPDYGWVNVCNYPSYGGYGYY
ncbi:MAG: hypothetical protein WA699_19325, partial [Pseudolabrys sp.]